MTHIAQCESDSVMCVIICQIALLCYMLYMYFLELNAMMEWLPDCQLWSDLDLDMATNAVMVRPYILKKSSSVSRDNRRENFVKQDSCEYTK
jgi:hypothetical protein